MTAASLQLKVRQIETVCLFELSWGRGQQLSTMLPYPAGLTTLYQEWQRTYLSFYKTVQMPIAPAPAANSALRGRVLDSGGIQPSPIDWHAKLVQAEAKLLSEFHRWLRSGELFEIRQAIALANQQNSAATTRVFLTCSPIELARFPWEAWELGSEFAATAAIRIIRTPATVRAEAVLPTQKHRRMRMLAILGDDTGLNFQADRAAVRSLASSVEVQFVGWQPGQTATEVKTQICEAIADAAGWDVLFFAGHSNETQITGGELAIAPGVALSIREIAPQLTAARSRGLQFALFNSCSGLSIAEALIDLGLSQVAVMREPIHNRVAQEFLLHFLQNLATFHDVHEALMAASQWLKVEKNLTYPSAYLVPSLFCHPDAELFRIAPRNWRQRWQWMQPSRTEAIALTCCVALSLIVPTQEWLLNQRVWLQAVYRDVTNQVPPLPDAPPVALVQIDEASTQRDARIAQPQPIDRSYLADLVNRLVDANATVIGIDYLLNRRDPRPGNDEILGQAIRTAVSRDRVWFVFGTLFDFEDQGDFAPEPPGIAERDWSLQAYAALLPSRVTLPYPQEDCRKTCPFAYLLSLTQAAQSAQPPQPQLDSQTDLRTQLLDSLDRSQAFQTSQTLQALQRSRLTPIAAWSYETLGLLWLEPILDVSIPPDRIYDRIAAWRVIEHPLDLPALPQQIVIISAGGYVEAGGVEPGNKLDYHPVPAAVEYWRDRLPTDNRAATFPNRGSTNTPKYLSVFTGAEVHAYMVHHLLNQRLVMPIPDLWMVGVAVLCAKGTTGLLDRQRQKSRQQPVKFMLGLTAATVLYGLTGLQLYISAAVLVPWMLPSLIFWVYVLPVSWRKNNA